MLEILNSIGTPAIPIPTGQAAYTTPGTFTWECPEDVYNVCFVIIAGGEPGQRSGSTANAGDGGGLRYRNNVPVVPGTKYTIVVGNGNGSPTSSALGTTVRSGRDFSGPFTGGGVGGSGENKNYQLASSGKAGRYDGAYPGTNYRTNMVGAGIYGETDGSFGSGGWAQVDGGGSYSGSNGRGGAVRIIWGANRRYPSTNVRDM